VLAPAMRRSDEVRTALTLTEILTGRSTGPARRAISILASAVVLVFMTAYVASQFQGAGKAFGETFGLPVTHSILIGSAIVVFYTLIGGFWAVSLTDTLQGLVMVAASLMLPIAALGAVGGPGGLLAGLQSVEVDGYMSLGRGLGPIAAAGLVAGLLGIGLGYPGQPHVVNRFMALRPGTDELRRARVIAVSWAVIVYCGMIVTGLAGRVLFPDLVDSEVVLLTTSNQLLHPVLAGVMLAAVMSAIMSTADSQLLVAASSVTHDLRPGHDADSGFLRGSRAVVLLLSLAAVLAALFGPREIFTPVLVAWSAMGAAFGPVLLVIVLRGPISPRRTLVAMSTGLVLTVVGAVLRSTVAGDWGGAAERVLPFVVALIIAASGPRPDRDQPASGRSSTISM